MIFTLSFITCLLFIFFFFFNDTATTEIYTLSLHDALPILKNTVNLSCQFLFFTEIMILSRQIYWPEDRKSTRLNSSHMSISYAVFCLKKKKKKNKIK